MPKRRDKGHTNTHSQIHPSHTHTVTTAWLISRQCQKSCCLCQGYARLCAWLGGLLIRKQVQFVAKRKKNSINERRRERKKGEATPCTVDTNYAFCAKFSYEIIILINFTVTNELAPASSCLLLPSPPSSRLLLPPPTCSCLLWPAPASSRLILPPHACSCLLLLQPVASSHLTLPSPASSRLHRLPLASSCLLLPPPASSSRLLPPGTSCVMLCIINKCYHYP